MKLTDLFIRRPVIAIVVNLVIVIAGLQAIRSLNMRQYPRNENAAITVTTAYVGAANAELVRGFITTPLERAISAADGIDYIASQSTQGVSIIRANLRLNQDSIRALSEISSKVDQVRGDLPPEAEVPILNIESVGESVRLGVPELLVGIPGAERDHRLPRSDRSAPAVSDSWRGAEGRVFLGARTFAMRIWLDPSRLAAHGVTPTDVQRALVANNYLAAVGQTKGSLIRVNLTTNTDLASVEEFKRLVIREKDGAIIRIEDVGTVALGAESYDERVNFTGQTAVFIGAFVLPNANALDVIRDVRAELEDIKRDLPSQLQATVAYDATAYIEDAIKEVVTTLLETLLIVVVVIFFFLGSFRLRSRARGRDPRFVDRGCVLDAALWVHTEPSHFARRRSVRRARGRRSGSSWFPERRTAPWRGPLEDRGRNRRCQGARHADHRDDHHVGGRVYADCVSGGAHRIVVPRVRAHARRGCDIRGSWP